MAHGEAKASDRLKLRKKWVNIDVARVRNRTLTDLKFKGFIKDKNIEDPELMYYQTNDGQAKVKHVKSLTTLP